MKTHLVAIVIVSLVYISSFLCTELCPQACVPCFEHLISCTFGGLTEIPKDLHIDTKKVTLIGHKFSQFTLSRQNFSRFSKPTYSIEQLSIRRSNIQIINSLTFFDLSGLDTLDLSDNVKLVIAERAFSNLKLKYMTLDNIGSLLLDARAFDELLVASLSMKNSNLETFPFSLLKPLSKDLRKLFLSNNNIKKLDSNFEALFRQLTVLDLQDNPLMCTCELLWLSTTLRWRHNYFQSSSNSFSNVLNPVCAGPSYLKGELLDRVPDSEFDCNPPKLTRIEIHFQNLNRAILRCAASTEARRAPVNISWVYINDNSFLNPPIRQTLQQYESSISVNQIDLLDRFICWMFSTSGNSSVNVNINWPISNLRKSPTNVTLHRNTFNTRSLDYQQNFFFKEQYSLLELLASVIGTFILTMLLFMIVYRFYFYKAIKLKKEQLKKSGYATYEVGLYSDSQTYDIPQYPSFDKRKELFQPVFSLPNTNKHIIDYTNHRKL